MSETSERDLQYQRVRKQEASWVLYRKIQRVIDGLPDAFTDTERLYDALHILGYTYDVEEGKYFYRLMDKPCPLTGQVYDGTIPPRNYV